MKCRLVPWRFLFILVWIHSCTNCCSVSSQCVDDQKTLLVELQSSLEFIPELSTKLVGWNRSEDCCHWVGVHCNRSNGQVIGLDFSAEAITSHIDNFSPLFRLQHLRSLNLAHNTFLGNIPSALGNLSNLNHLNLSHTNFTGQVPIQLSQLMNLVVLDLSMTKYEDVDLFASSSIRINSRNLAVIMQNLTQLRELYLGGIVFSAEGNKWGVALSVLPRLQVLSMPNCDLRGGFHPSLAKLHSLSVIDFDNNELLSAPVPDFLATFTNLTTLRLSNCGLTGTFPQKIFHVPTLETLELLLNPDLQGILPSSIGNLKRLITLILGVCKFEGIIPPSLGSLNNLEYLDLSFNNFSGPIPNFSLAKNLYFLELTKNSLSGSIPTSMFSTDSRIQFLDISYNNLEGSIPKIIFQLKYLQSLALDSNKLNGTVRLHDIFEQLPNLDTLQLSHNCFTLDASNTSGKSSFPQLINVGLASGSLRVLPDFIENLKYLMYLDLSNNQINGRIPKWIWISSLVTLNLSRNNFEYLEKPQPDFPSNLQYLDLSFNNIQGQLPAIPSQTVLYYVDFSNNIFISSIPNDIGNSLSSALYLSFARNKIYGSIPTSLCNATILQVLDLSFNNLNGTIPACLTAVAQNLAVLNLRDNKLHGTIPEEFGVNCTLETININGNFIKGRIPASLANCKRMSVLDLGNNKLSDTFPCKLKSLSSLQVLVLRSNRFHGTVVCQENNSFWPLIQIIDLASNLFTGTLSTLFLGTKMMTTTNGTRSKPNSLQYKNASTSFGYYQYEVVVTFKGFEFEFQKILTTFTSIDLSDNAFYGGLPGNLGGLNALMVLNFSHNSVSGHIPQSIGNLSQLESLDLCCNTLNGSIPPQLENLNFLSYLNLSFNNLSGQIPTSTQLQSFTVASYEGNQGLYGTPLTRRGENRKIPGSGPAHISHPNSNLEWILSGAAVGFPVGIAIFFGPLLCIKIWREWYNYHVDRLLMKVLRSKERQKKTSRRKASKLQKR